MNSQFRTVRAALVEHRQAYRHPVQIQRTAIKQRGKTVKAAELVDISIYGCRVSSESTFAEGTRVWLRFDGSDPVAASTVWCKDGQIGCRFDESLDHALFRRLTRIDE
ncbi:PilZ domain-containing protein [Parasphingorhabdus sp.]|uniref:PilZ domain-containing protein n=1 Tax=Parasphingorhabdus sp. TaxID=2709688 RepID=UPI003266B366